MEEKFIRNRLYHHLACRRDDAVKNPWNIDDFLAHALAILYPYVRDGEVEQEDKLKLPLQTIRTFRKSPKDKAFFDSLTELSLIDVIKYIWLPKISNKDEIALSFILVDTVSESGKITVKSNLVETYKNLNIPHSVMRYGTVDYEIAINEKEISLIGQKLDNETIVIAPSSPKTNISSSTKRSQEEIDFLDMWQRESLPTSLKEGEFIWQKRISLAQYEKIKAGLIALRLENKNAKFIRRYAFFIVVFLAEWFKREYDGYQNERGLSIIGINSQHSERIWESSKVPNSYLINSGVNEWLFSIYVLGGFPISYIKRVRRFDTLFNRIWTHRQGDDIDEQILEEFSNSFDTNNSVYQESMNRGGSLFAYIEALLDDIIPLSEDDKRIEPYKSYCEMLSEGKRACYSNYLSCFWSIYTDEHSEDVDTYISVKIGNKKNKCYIPCDCVMHWNVGSNLNEFVLGLETNTGIKSKQTIRFSKESKYYVGWGDHTSLSMIFDIRNTTSIKVLLYDTTDVDRENGKQIVEPFNFPEKCQFYRTNTPYKWSSSTNTSAPSAVLFNINRFQIIDGKEHSCYLVRATNNKNGWMWARIHDVVTLIDVETEQECTYNDKQGILSVTFAKQKGICYNDNGEVQHVSIHEDGACVIESIPLMLGINGIKQVKLHPFEENAKVQKISNYELYFKQKGWNYEELNSRNIPEFGIIQLKIKYKDYKPVIKKCFFVPQQDILKRKLETKKISFTMGGVDIWKPVDDDYVKDSGLLIYESGEYDHNADTIPFRIGTETDYIVIDVYRADNCHEISFKDINGNVHVIKKSTIVEIPLIIKNRFSVRIIDENGVRRTEPGQHVLLNNNFIVGNHRFNFVFKDDISEGIRYYLYTSKNVTGLSRNILKVSANHKNNYQFYYWTGEAKEQPIKLETSYDEATGHLEIPINCLNDRNKGIVFQSLKDTIPPNYVYPYYPPESTWTYLASRSASDDEIIQSMRIAKEHNVYFSQFYPLQALFIRYDNGEELVRIGLKYLQRHNKKEDILSLHRFASEFNFEWLFLPYKYWKSNCKSKEDQGLVEKLFRMNPKITSPTEKASLDNILELYWSLPAPNYWSFQRQKKYENVVLQSMRSMPKDYSFLARRSISGIITQPEKNIEILTETYSNNMFYKNLLNLINEKIINKQSKI